jgi:peroxiredoxin
MKMKLSVCLIFCIFAISGFSQDEPKSYTKVSQQMPDFSIKDLSGNNFRITDQKGKIILIYFWTTWCPYCKTELKFIEKEIWQKYKDSPDFVFLAIAREETTEQISSYKKANDFTFPMAADEKGDVFNLFGNRGVPRSYLVDTEGKIIAQTLGLDIEAIEERHKLLDKELKKLKKKTKRI